MWSLILGTFMRLLPLISRYRVRGIRAPAKFKATPPLLEKIFAAERPFPSHARKTDKWHFVFRTILYRGVTCQWPSQTGISHSSSGAQIDRLTFQVSNNEFEAKNFHFCGFTKLLLGHSFYDSANLANYGLLISDICTFIIWFRRKTRK